MDYVIYDLRGPYGITYDKAFGNFAACYIIVVVGFLYYLIEDTALLLRAVDFQLIEVGKRCREEKPASVIWSLCSGTT